MSCSGSEEAGLFAREAAFLPLRHMYAAIPPADIKDRVLSGIGGNGVSDFCCNVLVLLPLQLPQGWLGAARS